MKASNIAKTRKRGKPDSGANVNIIQDILKNSEIIQKNGWYILVYTDDGEAKELAIHPTTKDIEPFIKDLAEWTLEEKIEEAIEQELFDTWKIPIT